jgi:hypothetical protein
MAKNIVRPKKILAANEVRQHAQSPGFLFFWGRVGFWIFVVPIEFPSSFH